MHPSRLKNQALAAAVIAERDGFKATAEAFKSLATACAAEARELLMSPSSVGTPNAASSTQDGFCNFEILH